MLSIKQAQETLHLLGVPRLAEPFPPLPFDLVSRIIKEADGGRRAHKQQFDIVFGNWTRQGSVERMDEFLDRNGEGKVANLTQSAIYLEIQEDSGALRGKDLVGEHLGVTRVFTDFLEMEVEEERQILAYRAMDPNWVQTRFTDVLPSEYGNIWHFRNENLGWCVE